MRYTPLILLALCSGSFAESGAGIIESLLARRWIPLETQILWTSATRDELELDGGANWEVSSMLSTRPCGAMILKLAATDSGGVTRTITISGNADVRVNCLVAERNIYKGTVVGSDNSSLKLVEWKSAYGEPIADDAPDTQLTAARTIGAGRPICREDLESTQSIQSGERVMIRVTQGAVDVTVPGRALSGGNVGEEIRATTLLQPPRTLRGIVESKGKVHVELP